MAITPVSNTDFTTGAILKRARLADDRTQIEVANILGISKWTYIALENGRGTFHHEWISRLPEGMRNAVIQGFENRHRATIRENEEAIEALHKLMTRHPPAVLAPPPMIRRPTASAL